MNSVKAELTVLGSRFQKEWDNAADREKRSRTMFAQEGIQARVGDIAQELTDVRSVIGTNEDVEIFIRNVLTDYGASIQEKKHYLDINLSDVPRVVQEICGNQKKFKAHFELPVDENVLYLSRTHPFVEGLAAYVLNSALDGDEKAIASRCGVICTDKGERRTTLLLLRYRYHIITREGEKVRQLLAEDSEIVGFAGAPTSAEWIDDETVNSLLNAIPTKNIDRDRATHFIRRVLEDIETLYPDLERFTKVRGQKLMDAHQRVRSAARWQGVKYEVRPELPPDILGLYVYLPDQSANS